MPTFTWGGSSADWFAGPWVGGGVPGAADTAVLQPGTYGVTVAGGATVTIDTLNVATATQPFIFGPFTDPMSLTVAAGTTLRAGNGTMLGDGTLVLAGVLAGGLIVRPVADTGGIIGPDMIDSVPTLALAGGTLTVGMSVGAGRTLAVTAGTLRFADSFLPDLLVQGRLDLAGATTIDRAHIYATGSIAAETLTIAAGTELALASTLTATTLINAGEINAGHLHLAAGLTNAATGLIAVPASGSLIIDGSLSNDGTATIGAGGTLAITAPRDLAAPRGLGAVSGAGTLALTGTAAGGTVDLAAIAAGLGGVRLAGTIAGSRILAAPGAGITGDTVLDGVTVDGTLALLAVPDDVFTAHLPTIRNGLTLLGGTLPVVAPGGTLTADGTLAGGTVLLGASGTATLLRTAATIAIGADAVLATAGAGALGTVGGTLVNAGLIDAAGAGARLSLDQLANAGTLRVETGATVAVPYLSGGGAVQIAQGGTLRLGASAGAAIDFLDGSTGVLAGLGAVTVAGFAGNNAIGLGQLAVSGLGYSGDASGGRLTFSAPGTASVAGISFSGDYRTAPFIVEQRGTEAFLMLDRPGIPVLLADPAQFYAAQGNDTVVAGTGADTVSAGLRHVMAWGGSGSLTFLGDHGISTVAAGAGATSAYGGAGQLTVYGGTGPLLAQGGTLGGNLLVGGTGAATLIGGGDNDALFATGAAGSLLIAGPGAGTLSTQLATGANTVLASGGGKLIAAGAGADLIVAGSFTTVFGGSGATTIHGGSLVAAGSGDNVIDGAATVFGGTGRSTVYTAPFSGGTNVYAGGSGDQLIVATTGGPNLIYGGSGTQQILGGQGANTVIGGTGTEIFQASFGAALYLAGTGTDLLVIPNDQGASVLVGGFQPGTDFVQLQGYAPGEAAQAIAAQTHAGGATTLLLSDGARITFAGMDSVTSEMFI